MASAVSFTPWRCILLLLAALQVAAAADFVQVLAPRQSPNANALINPVCENYSKVANLSVIGLNSTYRAAFLRSAPMGTDAASSILDTESPKLMGMMLDKNLNAQCGNLSAIAFTEAANNLTKGIVADLTILEAPGVGVTGATTPLVVVSIVLLMCGMFISL
ncbi:putative ML-like domain-containing protein [Seiridium cardinale]